METDLWITAERYLNVCEVTHFDISQPMIDKATELAEKEGVLDKMTFVKGALEDILKRYGVKNIRLAGPGAYARTLPNELLVKNMKDSKQRSDFLDFCHYYDSNPFVCGMGKDTYLPKANYNHSDRLALKT